MQAFEVDFTTASSAFARLLTYMHVEVLSKLLWCIQNKQAERKAPALLQSYISDEDRWEKVRGFVLLFNPKANCKE